MVMLRKPKPRLQGSLRTLGLGLAVSLLLLESFLRIFPDYPISMSQHSERAWRRAHQTAEEIITKQRYSYDRYSPQLGWETKPNVRTPRLSSNSMGIRSVREYSSEPPTGFRRILCIGDSFMFGENLADNETLPAQLEGILNVEQQWEVLNLAVHGYGTDQQWLRLKDLGFQFRADLVILGFFEDDLKRNTMSFRDYAKPYFELVQEHLVLRNTPVPSPQELLSHPPDWPCVLRSWCALQSLMESLGRLIPRLPALEHTAAGKVTLAILDKMLLESRDHGLKFMLVIIPPSALRSSPSKVERLLLIWALRTGTPVVSLREAFRKLPRQEQAALYNRHWTAHGARIAAEVIANKIHEVW